ncbi:MULTISPECIES: metallophosphoesterase [unclassified Ruminococcus]|uniref:metallophosphoesterase family protein n=1 Tax=unclassified Ruminococcus TaxID=2608920 RepID=UPI00319DEA95
MQTLKIDLKQSLHLQKIDYVIISGDICDRPQEEQYAVALEFVENLCNDFSVEHEKVTVVLGNHACNYDISREAYKLDGEIDKNKYVERYKLFNEYFYKPFFGKEYSLDPEVQYTEYDDDDVSIIGLNSCYQIDYKQPKKSAISMDSIMACPALEDASSKIKLAVWHHSIYGEDCISKLDFLSTLAVTGFKALFHGHVHEAENQNFKYDDKRHIGAIGAGTLGAEKKDRAAGIPLQYNLVELDVPSRELIVHTRKREKDDRPWEADARWGDKNKNPVSYYTVPV